MKTAEDIREEGRTMSHEYLGHIVRKFREGIGGVYEVVAAAIEQQHAHVLPDGYIELDSDRAFTAWLDSIDQLTFNASGMTTTEAVVLAHRHLVPDLSDHPTTQPRKARS